MKGASIPPRQPMKDDSPDAWVIMLVGNSSGVTKKTAPNVPDAPTMPSIADITDSLNLCVAVSGFVLSISAMI